MITLTTRELIRSAKFIAGVRNTNLSNFEFTTSILNNIYRQLYQQIVDNTDSYISYIQAEASSDGIELPADCYQIEAVYSGWDWEHKVPLERSPRNEDVSGCWKIINNRVYVIDPLAGSVIIKYSTLPPTLTAPDDLIELKNLPTFDKMYAFSENELYLVDENESKNYIYNLDEKNYEETTITFEPHNYWIIDGAKKEIVVDAANQTIKTTDDEEVTSYFVSGDKPFKSVMFDFPHWMVSYEDGSIEIDRTEWNQKADTGHLTVGEIMALKTNDRTGKYAIYFDGSKYYEASFVPDTIINYPDNTFFQLLEYKLALFLTGQTNTSNTQLEEILLPEAEMQFYKSLSKSSNIVRTNNIYKTKTVI